MNETLVSVIGSAITVAALLLLAFFVLAFEEDEWPHQAIARGPRRLVHVVNVLARRTHQRIRQKFAPDRR